MFSIVLLLVSNEWLDMANLQVVLNHVQLLRQKVFMFLDTTDQKLKVSFRVKHSRGSYMVHVSARQIKCFESGDVRHLIFGGG